MRLFICLLGLLSCPGTASPRVLTSIQPLFQITSSIMQGVAKPRLLVGSNASTHHFAFKPSHLRALDEADLVIWIDRYFESGFQKLPEILPSHTEGLELLRELGLEAQDGHIWYSPILLLRIIDHIQSTLSRIDPRHKSNYRQNANQLSRLIENWDTATRGQLASFKPRYLLDHDFLRHFERDMGIEAIATLHDANQQSPGIRELKLIEGKLVESPALCILVNEPSATKLSQSIAYKFNLPIYNITPNVDAAGLAPAQGISNIIQSLNLLSSTLLKCS
ncbi:MAG: metal ABC transporter substrate-binding protein [Gammaproteobacteria bacterium]|nr:metal ABC transporter substrate-binding protein [Gammaproteobacteria bacterium]